MRNKRREFWAIFVSGNGSNAQVLLDNLDEYPVRLVVSSKPQVAALARARRRGIATQVLSKTIDWTELHKILKSHHICRIFLLGFMRIVPPQFVEQWESKIFNLHPSLLPAFPGLKAIEKSHTERAAMGVSVHHVNAEMDGGAIVFQKKTTSGGVYNLHSSEILISRDEQLLVRRLANKFEGVA